MASCCRRPRSPNDVIALAAQARGRSKRGPIVELGRRRSCRSRPRPPPACSRCGGYARCGPRLAALTWGAEDLAARSAPRPTSTSTASGCRRTSSRARCACSRPRRRALPAIDTVCDDLRDEQRLAPPAAAARRDGFVGKLAIHPAQVEVLESKPFARASTRSRPRSRRRRRSRPHAAPASWRSTARWSTGRISRARVARSASRPHSPRATAHRARRKAKRGGADHVVSRKVDHVTYACARGTIEKWAWFHIEVEGGTLINRIDDVPPARRRQQHEALVRRLRRLRHRARRGHRPTQEIAGHEASSSVTAIIPASTWPYDCHDLERFRRHLLELGGHQRGARAAPPRRLRHAEADVREGLRGRRCDRGELRRVRRAAEGRSDDDVQITFSEAAGSGFYEQIEEAIESGDEQRFIDFSRMPKDWSAPAARPRTERH